MIVSRWPFARLRRRAIARLGWSVIAISDPPREDIHYPPPRIGNLLDTLACRAYRPTAFSDFGPEQAFQPQTKSHWAVSPMAMPARSFRSDLCCRKTSRGTATVAVAWELVAASSRPRFA